MNLIFATNNPHKIAEVAAILGPGFTVGSLTDLGCTEEPPETSPTIEGNALQKARYVYERYGVDCFAEDTGLEVDALGGAPGVHSARYAGPGRDAGDNMRLLLHHLGDAADRSARFRTVIALILNGKEYTFAGAAQGRIAGEASGDHGFGYDPVFVPAGERRSFAEMTPEEKNAISHRAKAVRKLVEFLQKP
jgi:XTP/dITP diphosphohydrolase